MSPTVNDLKDSKFLKKEDVDPAVLVTIAGWDKVNVAMESQAEELKYVLTFQELPKPLVLNITNGMSIQDIAGTDDFDEWVGKKIVLFNDPNVSFAGKRTGGIRVRAPQQNTIQATGSETTPWNT